MSACPSEQQIVDFLDGKLGPAKGSEVHRHVDGCTSCRALLAGLAPSINRSTLDEHPFAASPSSDFPRPEPLHRTAAMTGAEPAGDVSMAAAARVASVLPLVNDDRYDVRDEFARGGLGRIFRAHDKRLARPVAVKQLLAGGSEAARRFIREALITARLQHPAIVPIYEAGRWPSGEPFYAMKLVSGRSLDQVIRSKKTLAERLTLLPNVIAVAEAMAYAHSQRIIHRDLKPANVLVGSFGETVLIDWGLAKDLSTGTEVGSDAMMAPYTDDDTEIGTVLGTPTYMPPEQAEGKAVDERADVYALGALLYHVLAGAPPYAGSSSAETLARVLSEPPTPLSTREPGVPRDLVTIVQKAMARDQAGRYPTAREFVEDLVSFQGGQLVSAHRYSTMEMVRRWIQRHRAPVSVGVSLLTALIMTGTLAVSRIAHERDAARKERAEARAAQAQAEKRSSELVLAQAQQSLDDDPTAALAWLKQYPDTGDWRAAQAIFAEAQSRGIAERVWNWVSRAHFLPDGRLLLWGEDSAVRLWSSGGREQTLGGGGQHVNELALTAKGDQLALLRGDSGLELWDLASATGHPVSDGKISYSQIAIAPDGKWLAAVARDGSLDVWSLPGAARKRIADGSSAVRYIDFGADGVLASGGSDRKVRLWDMANGSSRVLGKHDAPVWRIGYAPDHKTLISADERHVVKLWDVAGQSNTVRTFVGRGEQRPEWAFSGDGKLALASGGGIVQLVDLASGVTRTLHGHAAQLTALAFLPDGKRLITASEDQIVRVWDTITGENVALRGHGSYIATLTIEPGGRHFASGSADKTVRLWSVPQATRAVRLPDSELYSVVFSPDGKRIVAGGVGGLMTLCDAETLVCRPLAGHHDDVMGLVFSGDGRELASASDDETVRVWDLAAGTSRLYSADAASEAIAFSPDGARIAFAASARKLVVAEPKTSRLYTLDVQNMARYRVEFSPDGQKVTAADGNDAVVWDWATGAVQRLVGHSLRVRRSFFSPDGTLVATASDDDNVGLWKLADGSHRFLRGHTGMVAWANFSPDGKRLATTGFDGSVRVWSTSDGQAQLVLHGRRAAVRRALFSPDGKRLASAGDDATVHLWDATTGDGYVVRGFERPVRDLAWSPDGKRLAAVAADGRLQVIRLDEVPPFGGHDPRTLRPLLEHATTAVIGPDDRPVGP
jgi:WD40 repeat protein